MLAIVAIMFLRAVRSAFDVTRGYRRLRRNEQVDWNRRLRDLGDPRAALGADAAGHSGMFAAARHRTHQSRIALDPARYPHPEQVLNAVIVAAYNESYDVIAPTIRALAGTHYDRARLAVFFAYEERGCMPMLSTARRLREEFVDAFAAFELVCHPRDLPGEIAGKGANISFAGRAVQEWAQQHGIDPSRVLITTLDCDNKPHANYFDCVTYHFIVHANRTRAAFQPVSLFLNNIWEAPAPTRVVASGNTFRNLISSVRPRSLRNFASHSQPLDALIEMDFWSRRTIVEDGHQYWRSYFHFRGDYTVVPIPTSISGCGSG